TLVGLDGALAPPYGVPVWRNNDKTSSGKKKALSRASFKRMMGLEPTTFCMASRRSSQLSYIRATRSIALTFLAAARKPRYLSARRLKLRLPGGLPARCGLCGRRYSAPDGTSAPSRSHLPTGL